MHHGTDTYSTCSGKLCLCTILLFNVHKKALIAPLKPAPYILKTVGPYSMFITILPFMSSGCYRLILFIDQHSLDPGRPKLNPKSSPALQDCLPVLCNTHYKILPFPFFNLSAYLLFGNTYHLRRNKKDITYTPNAIITRDGIIRPIIRISTLKIPTKITREISFSYQGLS